MQIKTWAEKIKNWIKEKFKRTKKKTKSKAANKIWGKRVKQAARRHHFLSVSSSRHQVADGHGVCIGGVE